MDDIELIFRESAFEHGLSEADIRFAINNFVYDEVIAGDETKRLLIGLDKNARLLEIIYNEIDELTVNVFHAMICQKKYLRYLEK
ncbi:hypothetical protein AGMMS49940_21000 [Spirochaetia bacterium]|nr:hypothetical protein AGMMS49940_21000 [Spirochaetia bacterium]